MEYKDYYDILGVQKDASQADIQRAYRGLARKYHPDVNRETDAENRFKEIGEAYEVLKDPEKRAKYDQFGSAWKTAQKTGAPPPGWDHVHFDFGGGDASGFDFGGFGSSGFSSFFEMLFGGGGPGRGGGSSSWGPAGFGGGRPRAAPAKGQDRESRIALRLEDLASGGERKVELSDPLTGSRRNLVVKIPRGIRPGQKIRLSGQGDPGANGAGDLYLVVDLIEHPRFALDGFDLKTTLAVTPWEAALGGKAKVETLTGTVSVKLPAGSSSGRQIRLRGRGLPRPDGGAGDLYIILKIVVPTELSDKEQELFQQLAEASSFHPGKGKRAQSRPTS